MKGEELDHWEYGLSVARQMVCGVCFLYFVSESIFSILFHVMIYFDLVAVIFEGDYLYVVVCGFIDFFISVYPFSTLCFCLFCDFKVY